MRIIWNLIAPLCNRIRSLQTQSLELQREIGFNLSLLLDKEMKLILDDTLQLGTPNSLSIDEPRFVDIQGHTHANNDSKLAPPSVMDINTSMKNIFSSQITTYTYMIVSNEGVYIYSLGDNIINVYNDKKKYDSILSKLGKKYDRVVRKQKDPSSYVQYLNEIGIIAKYKPFSKLEPFNSQKISILNVMERIPGMIRPLLLDKNTLLSSIQIYLDLSRNGIHIHLNNIIYNNLSELPSVGDILIIARKKYSKINDSDNNLLTQFKTMNKKALGIVITVNSFRTF